LSGEVVKVLGISRCVTCCLEFALGITRVVMVLRYALGILQFERSFNHGRDQTTVHMPFDVAMEEPNTWVVGLESDEEVALRPDHQHISAHGNGGERRMVAWVVKAIILFSAD